MNVGIKNKGEGMPEEIKEYIFEKFKHANVGNNQSGTGIGLYNVKNIIEKHGGKISFVSERDKWTEFNFNIPLNLKSNK
jgi:signal transduction histidine kinase